MNVSLVTALDLFIVSQVDGTINFRSMKDGSHLSFLNDSTWDSNFFKTVSDRD